MLKTSDIFLFCKILFKIRKILDKFITVCYTKSMETIIKNNNIILRNVRDFDLRHIFECGQCFRFDAVGDGVYEGVAFSKALRISQSGDTVTLYGTSKEDFDSVWYNYFDLGCDYGEIKKTLSRDKILKNAIKDGGGIRILNQDLWETIISFIISASNNIPRIKGIINRFCENFGEEIRYMDKTYYAFPTPEKTASLTQADLSVIRAGYRDKYIMDAAEKIASGKISLDYIQGLSADAAKDELRKINGIGEKVANCILLFGLRRVDAFPVDVWIKRTMEQYYFGGLEQPISEISHFAKEKFGDLGGYAQQYLFFSARENK